MEKTEEMKNEVQDLSYEALSKKIFNNVIDVLRENFVATFFKEENDSLLMRFVCGLQVRIKLEEVFEESL